MTTRTVRSVGSRNGRWRDVRGRRNVSAVTFLYFHLSSKLLTEICTGHNRRYSQYPDELFDPVLMRATFILLGLMVASVWRCGSMVAAADSGSRVVKVRAFPDTAAIQGRVSVSGAQQKLKPLPVFKNRVFCGTAVSNVTLLIGSDGRGENP